MKYTNTNKPLVCMQTQSHCYKYTSTMNVKGVLWHSTASNNPTLKRYVQPSDTKPAEDTYSKAKWLELLGTNYNYNDSNHPNSACYDPPNTCDKYCIGLNCWIGELADGTVTTVQTMPWNYRPWGCGEGDTGYSCNSGWIQFEICEDDRSDATYFSKVYKEACEITAYLCKMYNLNPKGTAELNGIKVPVILGHADSHRLGLGSNHGDPDEWFSKYGITMDRIRSDVASLLSGADFTLTPEDGSSSGSTTTIDPTVPIKPIETILIKKVSITNSAFDNIGVKLETSEFYKNYTWSYITTNLHTGKASSEQTFKVASKKTNFTIKKLDPNSCYTLEIIAKDSNENKTSVSGLMFSTKQDNPREVTDVDLKLTGTKMSDIKCQISFVHPDFWGFCKAGITGKGYRTSLVINGQEKGYSDKFFTVGNTSKNLMLTKLFNHFKIEMPQYNDIIQVRVLPWIKDTQKNFVFAEAGAKCSQPVRLKYDSNINIIDKIYLKTSKGFKRVALFNFSK